MIANVRNISRYIHLTRLHTSIRSHTWIKLNTWIRLHTWIYFINLVMSPLFDLIILFKKIIHSTIIND